MDLGGCALRSAAFAVAKVEPVLSLVDQEGIEPSTSSLRTRRSTDELLALVGVLIQYYLTIEHQLFRAQDSYNPTGP